MLHVAVVGYERLFTFIVLTWDWFLHFVDECRTEPGSEMWGGRETEGVLLWTQTCGHGHVYMFCGKYTLQSV